MWTACVFDGVGIGGLCGRPEDCCGSIIVDGTMTVEHPVTHLASG